jgi:murein DD-endopeptidase MepM/ murein hydrolase activator NlpD
VRPIPLFPIALLLPLLVAACATPQPPRQGQTASRPPAAAKPAQSAAQRQRWQAVPAKADGAVVPGGRRHIVKPGETGIAIANAYRVPWSRIAAANRLDRDAVLQVGQPLFVPTSPPASARAGAAAKPSQPTSPGESSRPGDKPAGFELDMDDLITGSAPAREGPAPAAPATRPVAPPAVAASVPALGWPVDGRVILSRYGPKPGGRVNDGVNIKTLRGAPVRAAASGEVIYVGDAIAGFGLMMLVRHPGGTVTAYGHLEDALADRGDKVGRGQPIARAGSSGNVSEPQLHFQLRQGRRTLDPQLYLPR